MSFLDPQVGDEFWVAVRNDRRNPSRFPAVVTKVGRKWVHLDDGSRFDLTDGGQQQQWWWLDGGDHPSPGRVYRSQDSYLKVVEADQAWRELCKKMRAPRPVGVTVHQIHEAERFLGLSPCPNHQ